VCTGQGFAASDTRWSSYSFREGLTDDAMKEDPNTTPRRPAAIVHQSAVPGSDDFPKGIFPV